MASAIAPIRAAPVPLPQSLARSPDAACDICASPERRTAWQGWQGLAIVFPSSGSKRSIGIQGKRGRSTASIDCRSHLPTMTRPCQASPSGSVGCARFRADPDGMNVCESSFFNARRSTASWPQPRHPRAKASLLSPLFHTAPPFRRTGRRCDRASGDPWHLRRRASRAARAHDRHAGHVGRSRGYHAIGSLPKDLGLHTGKRLIVVSSRTPRSVQLPSPSGTPEVGGPTTHEALAFVRRLKGPDIVEGEVAPQYDATTNTAQAYAQFLFEILSPIVFSPFLVRAARDRDANAMQRLIDRERGIARMTGDGREARTLAHSAC